MLRRDRRDRERLDSPLRPCPESLWLDTTLMSVDEQVEHAAAMYSALRGVAS
jgi:cytidylate kinase